MEILDNAALRFSAPPEVMNRVLPNIQKSDRDGDNLIVYWDYPEASYLASVIDTEQPHDSLPDVPSPMLRDYDWPGLYTPFEHQKHTASFLSLRTRAFCFNEAGTGKTSAAVWAADYLMNLGKVKRVLVICPLSIMWSAWQNDIFRTAMHRSGVVAHGSSSKRKEMIRSKYDFVIINFDGVGVVHDEIMNADFDLIIVDEANSYKNASSKRWKYLAKLIRPHTRLWMMTGTPASQSPVDAFGLAKLVSPWRVPKYLSAWRGKVMLQVSRFSWVPASGATKQVHYALQPAIRYTKSECLDLPELMYQYRDVPLTQQAAEYYKELKTELLMEAAGEQVSAVNAAAKLNKLLQISGGAVYTDGRDVLEFDITPRLNALKEILDETSNKVVVFVPYRHTIQVVSEYLHRQNITTEIINGEVSARERADIIDRFQTQKDPHVLVIQPQAASHGVTLTAADTIVFWSPVMSVETYLQCIARIDRVGQKNSTTVVHIQGSEVEKRVYSMLNSKVSSHQKIVDLYKQEMGYE